MKPDKVILYENTIYHDPKANTKEYNLKIWFANDKGEKLLYTYNLPQGEAKGNFNVERV